MSGEATAMLKRALNLSRQVLEAADRGDSQAVASLDAERLQLLKSARKSAHALDANERLMLQEVARLNDRSIGHLEHHRRIKERQLDVAVVGRRAVNAYAGTRQLR
jgi:CBS domain containing-hemolysin-like protein